MIYLGNLSENEDGTYKVGMISYQPFDPDNGEGKTEDELRSTGMLVEFLPDKMREDGVLTCRPSTGELWYNYPPEPAPETLTPEQIAELQKENAALKTLLKINE